MPNKSTKPPCPFDRHWQVKAGDTLFSIAQVVGTTAAVLIKLNPDVNPLDLQPGDLICLPEARPCPSGVFWVVEPGDTLFLIAKATDTPLAELQKLNPDLDPLNLRTGQSVCLP